MEQWRRARWTRYRLRLVRALKRTSRDLDGTTALSVVLQWGAAMFLAVSLAKYNVVVHSGMRTLLLVVASVSGPLTCMGLLRATKRMRKQRFQREHLVHRTRHDELTGLPNRSAMQAHLNEALATANEEKTPVTCFYLDLDGLRFANTMHGYTAGDQLLQEMVRRVSGCLAPTDHLSRFGGDKFFVLVHRSLSRGEMDALAEAILHAVARPQLLNEQECSVGVSIGIAAFPIHARTAEALMAAAERAMYAVKRSGRSAFRYAEHEESACDVRSRVLAEKLQCALHVGGLRLDFQPIYAAGGDLVAAEALCRWYDQEEGNISPAEFIPIAEATGLIVPLSKWVLRRACEQMQAWRSLNATLQRVAVNICVLQASRNDFVATVKCTLAETGLPPECLELEVTESALAQDFDSVKQHLQQLRELGIRIAIDDFGTGYSSFGRLRDLEVDALKIDRVFVQGARETHNGIAVVQAIVDMAHTLQLSVVAEGVETADQLQMLRDIQCDEIQGFLLARPQAAAEFLKLLSPPPDRDEAAGSWGYAVAHHA